ncbi:hypothetical protein DMC30DRAFT_135907 [Rhodotorula diobovata]|uniref:Uncharacterized protein n=1 Tax=Rhodotorula diobovata TaxID=5288 RepID=A0A5C5G0Z8_9BASI|nr:hypothetical protein DMC30DRAFT_135907 [Rhodotorula diobovata]
MPPWSAYEQQSSGSAPHSPAAPPRSPARALDDSGSHLSAFPTPPPSLPASSPGSPETPISAARELPAVLSTSASTPPIDVDMPPSLPSPAGPRRRKKRVESDFLPSGLANLDEHSGQVFPGMPSSLKSGVPFPAPADDRTKSTSRSREGTSGRSESRKRASHSTTSTTSTRKTERRQVRYSFPGLDHLVSPGPHASPHRPRSSSTGSSRARSPTSTPRKSSASQTGRTPRRSSHKSEAHPAPHPPEQQRRRSASYSTPATSSPFFRRSSSASSYAIQRRQSTASSGADDFALLPAASAPFLRPLVNAFAFFVVSAVAAMTISAVLATSFSLTFYDDCTRRVGSVQRTLGGSIEGVRAGMGRVLGNARGALDLAVRAAGAGPKLAPAAHDSAVNLDVDVDVEAADRRRTTIPTVPQAQEPELETEEAPEGGTGRAKRTRSTSAQADAFAPAAAAPSSKRRRAFSRNQAAPQAFTPTGTSGHSTPRVYPEGDDGDEPGAGAATPGWRTDDDDGAALPFRVPHSTPRSSRAASPHRDRTGPHASGRAKASLPPRPPLAVLIPSIVFALLFTLSKVLFQAWKGRNGGPCATGRARY